MTPGTRAASVSAGLLVVGAVVVVLVLPGLKPTEAPVAEPAVTPESVPTETGSMTFEPAAADVLVDTQMWQLAELPTTLNPLFARSPWDALAQSLVYDRLFYQRPDDGSWRTRVVEELDVDPDGRTVSLTLRAGLRWQDGPSLSGADVCASVELLAEVGQELPGGAHLESCEEAGAHSAILRFAEPLAEPEAALAVAVLPAHHAAELIDPSSELKGRPVGSAGYAGRLGRRGVRFDLHETSHHQPRVRRLDWSATTEPVVAAKTMQFDGSDGWVGPTPESLLDYFESAGTLQVHGLGELGLAAFSEQVWDDVVIDERGWLHDFDQSTLRS